MIWRTLRDRYCSAADTVANSSHIEGLTLLAQHEAVKSALAMIEIAERAINDIANEMLVKFYDEDEE